MLNEREPPQDRAAAPCALCFTTLKRESYQPKFCKFSLKNPHKKTATTGQTRKGDHSR